MLAKPVSRPWRRFLRVSVRGLIVVVLLVGGWSGWIVRSARIQRDATSAARRTGGWVRYDWEERGDDGAGFWGEPAASPWLVELIGVEYFGHIVEVRLGVIGTEAAIAPVARLERVQWLRLDRTPVTDIGLAQLRGMTSITRLDLDDTRVTDVGLAQLKRLTKLKHLNLSGTQVTDAGVRELREALPPGMSIGR
jgi:internalin A